MFSFLANPYPTPHIGLARNLLVSLLVGLFVAGFLIAFKPFGTASSTIPNLNLFLLGYGGVITGAVFLPHFFLSLVAPRFFSEAKWTIGRQILYLLGIVSLGISASYWYLLQAGGWASWGDYLYFFQNGLLVASFPILIVTLLDYIRKLRYYESGAASVNSQREAARLNASAAPTTAALAPAAAPPDRTATLPPITLTDDQGREAMVVRPEKLWCLHSDGNYVEAWAQKEGGDFERLLIRNTLANLTELLVHDHFVTCHRSWVVNVDLVENVTGNAQGYQLHLAGGPTVTVARGRSKMVLARLKE